jgi:hypothetical protein
MEGRLESAYREDLIGRRRLNDSENERDRRLGYGALTRFMP